MFNALADQLPGEVTRTGVIPYVTGAVTAWFVLLSLHGRRSRG